jgi:transcriptional regulator with XRE-family HTH domain
MEKHPALVALGAQIRQVREKKGISQEDFAALAGLSRAYYGSIERGERNVAALNLMRIARALDSDVGKLFPPMSEFAPLLQADGIDGGESNR